MGENNETIFFFMICLLGIVLSFNRPLGAQTLGYDVSNAKNAIHSLKQMPDAVQKVLVVIDGSDFGPFRIEGQCDYSCHWYTFGLCLKKFSWSWKFPNFVWLKDDLKLRYNNVRSVSSQFDRSFSPVRNWLLITLPKFSQEFDEATDRIMKAEAVIKNRNSSSAQKQVAENEIIQLITQIDASLQRDTAKIRDGISNISSFNQRMNSALQNVKNARQGMDNMIAKSQKRLNDKVVSYPCDANEVRDGYNRIKDKVLGQFQSVENAAKELGVVSSQTDRANSIILGTLINIQNNFKGVIDKLHTAKITPASAVQELRLNVAKAAWRDLADYARQQL